MNVLMDWNQDGDTTDLNERLNRRVIALEWALGLDDPADVAKHLDILRRCADLANVWGCGLVRGFAGFGTGLRHYTAGPGLQCRRRSHHELPLVVVLSYHDRKAT